MEFVHPDDRAATEATFAELLEGGDTLLTSCGRGIAFGSDVTVKKYAPYPSISVHGTGRSKILIGEDMIERWPEFVDVIVQSISANGGRSCINTSAILVPSHRDELAEALARSGRLHRPARPSTAPRWAPPR